MFDPLFLLAFAGARVVTMTGRERFLAIVRAQLGKRYIWGATGPVTFDCSGLVFYAYKKAGIRVPRLVTEQSAQAPYRVHINGDKSYALSILQPGDCIGMGRAADGRFIHVGVYTEAGTIIHASGGQSCKITGAAGMRCKVVEDKTNHWSGSNWRSIYSFL